MKTTRGFMTRDDFNGKTLSLLCFVVSLSILIPLFLAAPDAAPPGRENLPGTAAYFPCVQLDSGWKTRLGLANPARKETTVRITAHAANGDGLGTVSALTRLNPRESRSIDARGLPPGARALVVASSAKLSGYAMIEGTSGKSESLPLIRDVSEQLDFPALAGEGNRFRSITLFNPNGTSCAAHAIALDKEGVEIDSATLPSLDAMESKTFSLAELFSVKSLESLATVRLLSDKPIAGVQLANRPDADLIGLPALSWTSSEWFLPVVRKSGKTELWTEAYLFNPGKQPALARMEAFDASGHTLGLVDEVALMPRVSAFGAATGGSKRLPATAAFLKITADQPIVAYEILGVTKGIGRAALLGLTRKTQALQGLDIRFAAETGSLTAFPKAPSAYSDMGGTLRKLPKEVLSNLKPQPEFLKPDKLPVRTAERLDVCGDITTNTTWTNGKVYVLTCHVTVRSGATLTIEAGTVVKFPQGWNFLFVEGGLLVQGEAGAPVVFTSYKDDSAGGDTNGDGATSPAAGDWGRIEFMAGSSGAISYARLSYGGWNSNAMVQSVSSNVTLDHVTLEKSSQHGLLATGATVNVTNSTVRDHALNGLFYQGLNPATPLVLTDDTFTNNGLVPDAANLFEWNVHPVLVTLDGNPSKITLMRNTGSGNRVNGLAFSGTIKSNMTFDFKDSLPITISRRWMDLRVGSEATLTLLPGTIFKMGPGVKSDSLTNLLVQGALIAEGTDAAPIVFTSVADDSVGGGDTNNDGNASTPIPGVWGAVYFASGSHGTLSRLLLRYGGGDGWMGNEFGGSRGTLHSLSSDVTVDQVTIEKSGIYGLYASKASVSLTHSTLRGSQQNGVYYDELDPAKALTLTDNLFENNGLQPDLWALDSMNAGHLNIDGNPPAINLLRNTGAGNKQNCFYVRGTLTQDVVWDNTASLPLFIENCWEDLLVEQGAVLTLKPGSIVKFMPTRCDTTARGLVVKGGLVAEGTKQTPIVFTSFFDDKHGGDTNGDGDATVPAPGNWGAIGFETGSSGRLRYAFVGYGGAGGSGMANYGGFSGMVDSRSSEVALDHVTLQGSGMSGLYAANAAVGVTNSLIQGNVYDGLYYSGLDVSTPLVITDNAFKQNGSYTGFEEHHLQYAAFLAFDGNPPQILLQRNTASGNTKNSFGVRGSIKKDLVWENTASLPLTVVEPIWGGDDLTVEAGATLTLLPGTVVKLRDGWWDYRKTELIVKGGLIAQGTSALPIAFTSQRDDSRGGDSNNDGSTTSAAPGDWGSIRFEAGSHASITNAFIGYGAGGRAAGESYNMVQSASSEVILDHVKLQYSGDSTCQGCSGNSAFYAADAGPILRNCIVSNNVFGVGTNNGAYWVDARTCYWGDPSGPYHAQQNPSGKGNAVGEKVLFYPWAEDEAMTLTQQILVSIKGPQRAAPGEIADYAVSYHTGKAVKNAVLIVGLPTTAEFVRGSEGAIYRPESNEVFWKLGNLKALQEGTHTVKVQFNWGVPNGVVDGATAILVGPELNMGSTKFNVGRYLNYTPPSQISRTLLSQSEVSAELNAYPNLKALHDKAVSDGFVLIGGMENRIDEKTFTVLFLLSKPKGAKIELVRDRADDTVTSNYYSPSLYGVSDTTGGMTDRLDVDAVEFTGSWGSGTGSSFPEVISAETLADVSQDEDDGSLGAEPTGGICFRNCLIQTFGIWSIKKLSPLANRIINGYDCTVALIEMDAESLQACADALKGGADDSQLADTAKEAVKACYNDCITEGNISKYACDPDKPAYKAEPCESSWVFGGFMDGRKRQFKEYRCNPTTQMWHPLKECRYCDYGYVAQDGAKDGEGLPCVPANDGQASAMHDPSDTKVPSASTSTAVRPARDPNEKIGPAGNLLPDQKVKYTVNYENEGQGQAYGVYVLDKLNPALDESTLDIQGSGRYLKTSRTILWDVGELSPKGQAGSKGSVGFSAKLKPDLPAGTVVSNQAVVYFPSVPEETPTNTVVNTIEGLVAHPQSVVATSGVPVQIQLKANSATGAALSYAITQNAVSGELTGIAPNLTYKSGPNFSGSDSFSFRVSSGESVSDSAQVSITVKPKASDTVPPQVIWTSPYDGETVKQAAATPSYTDEIGPVYVPTLVVEFSEVVKGTTVTAKSIQLADLSGREVKHTVVYDATTRKATVQVREPWQSTRYTATVTTAVEDLNGNALKKAYLWNFDTVSTASLPVVSVSVSDALASEPGKDTAKFKITRKGDTSGPLIVRYALSGTAKNGADYRKLTGRVRIAPGKAFAEITVKPLDDKIKEKVETVNLTLKKATSYKLGAPKAGTVRIKDND